MNAIASEVGVIEFVDQDTDHVTRFDDPTTIADVAQKATALLHLVFGDDAGSTAIRSDSRYVFTYSTQETAPSFRVERFLENNERVFGWTTQSYDEAVYSQLEDILKIHDVLPLGKGK